MKKYARKNQLLLILLSIFILSLFLLAPAQAIRSFNRINVAIPDATQVQDKSVPQLGRVAMSRVRNAIQSIADAWNNGGLDRVLLPGFQDRQRLLNTMDQTVPRDAILKVMSIGAVSTLGQRTKISQHNKGEKIGEKMAIRTVTAIVNTQIEFNDPVTGFQRLEGRYEWILQFRDSLPE